VPPGPAPGPGVWGGEAEAEAALGQRLLFAALLRHSAVDPEALGAALAAVGRPPPHRTPSRNIFLRGGEYFIGLFLNTTTRAQGTPEARGLPQRTGSLF